MSDDEEPLPAPQVFERSMRILQRTVGVTSKRDEETNTRFQKTRVAGFIGLVVSLCLAAAGTVSSTIWGVALVISVLLLRASVDPTRKIRLGVVGHEANVRISKNGIKVRNAPFIRADTIAAGFYQPRSGQERGSVCCTDGKGALLFEAEVESEQEAAYILRALGRDVAQQRVTFTTTSPIAATGAQRGIALLLATAFFGVTIASMDKVHIAGPLTVLILALVPVLALALAWMKSTTDVGVDGIFFRWGGVERFVSYAKMKSAVPVGVREVLITTEDNKGKKKSFTIAVPTDRAGGDELSRQALLARITEARRAYHGFSAQELAARVARGSRDIATWRAQLADLRQEAGTGYRQAATRDEDLWRLVEDASASEDVRAAAALLLRDREDAPPRLRIAADAAASPKLRVALSTVADRTAEDGALDHALEALDAEEATEEEAEEEAEEDEEELEKRSVSTD